MALMSIKFNSEIDICLSRKRIVARVTRAHHVNATEHLEMVHWF